MLDEIYKAMMMQLQMNLFHALCQYLPRLLLFPVLKYRRLTTTMKFFAILYSPWRQIVGIGGDECNLHMPERYLTIPEADDERFFIQMIIEHNLRYFRVWWEFIFAVKTAKRMENVISIDMAAGMGCCWATSVMVKVCSFHRKALHVIWLYRSDLSLCL